MADIELNLMATSGDGVTPGTVDTIETADIDADAVTGAKILDATIELADLATIIAPSHVVKFAGAHAYAGGGTSDAATITGVAATDIVVATIKSKTNAGYLDLAVPTTNTVTFTFSADPGANTVVYYTILTATV